MKTKTLVTSLVVGLLTLGQPVWAASNRATALSRTTTFEQRQRAQQARQPATLSERNEAGRSLAIMVPGDP